MGFEGPYTVLTKTEKSLSESRDFLFRLFLYVHFFTEVQLIYYNVGPISAV